MSLNLSPKLMILGAGPFQVPAIRKARELGCYVIALSNLPDDPGLALADKSYVCSTLAQQEVLEIARAEEINGILTVASEVAAPTVAYVAQMLQLPGFPLEAAETISNKFFLRAFLQQNALSGLHFAKATHAADAEAVLEQVPLPCMVKPLLASGSKGLKLVHTARELQQHLPLAIAQSYRYPGALAEEFAEGKPCGAQALVVNGKVGLLTLSEKFMNAHFVTTGHLLPAWLPQEVEEQILKLVKTVVKEMGLTNGALDLDLVLTPDGPEIIEMGGRLGGNNLAELVSRHTGVDWVEQVIRLALGQKPKLQPQAEPQPVAVHLIGSDRPGTLRHISRFSEVFPDQAAHLLAQQDVVRPGEPVLPFTQGNHQLGAILLTHPDKEALGYLLARVQQTSWVQLQEEVPA